MVLVYLDSPEHFINSLLFAGDFRFFNCLSLYIIIEDYTNFIHFIFFRNRNYIYYRIPKETNYP